jgi:hypothetical protein
MLAEARTPPRPMVDFPRKTTRLGPINVGVSKSEPTGVLPGAAGGFLSRKTILVSAVEEALKGEPVVVPPGAAEGFPSRKMTLDSAAVVCSRDLKVSKLQPLVLPRLGKANSDF